MKEGTLSHSSHVAAALHREEIMNFAEALLILISKHDQSGPPVINRIDRDAGQ